MSERKASEEGEERPSGQRALPAQRPGRETREGAWGALSSAEWPEQRVCDCMTETVLRGEAGEAGHRSHPGQAGTAGQPCPTHTQLPGTPVRVTQGTSSAKQPFPASPASPALWETQCPGRRLAPAQVPVGRKPGYFRSVTAGAFGPRPGHANPLEGFTPAQKAARP